MKGEGVTVTELPQGTPPAVPPDGIGKVIAVGNVDGTAAMGFARNLAAEQRVTVVITDIGPEASAVTEGLPVHVEIQPVIRSEN